MGICLQYIIYSFPNAATATAHKRGREQETENQEQIPAKKVRVAAVDSKIAKPAISLGDAKASRVEKLMEEMESNAVRLPAEKPPAGAISVAPLIKQYLKSKDNTGIFFFVAG